MVPGCLFIYAQGPYWLAKQMYVLIGNQNIITNVDRVG